MEYLSFEKYNQMGGKGIILKRDFDRLEFRARSEIKRATLGRVETLDTIPDSVQRCMFELILFLSKIAKDGNVSNVTGFSNDGYSVSYSDKKSAEQQIYDIIRTYLEDDENNLLFCGVD